MVAFVVVVSACTAASPSQTTEPVSAPGDVVGEDGLELSVGDIDVSFPAGSATGAEVTAEPLEELGAPSRVPFDPPAADLASEEVVEAFGDGLVVVPLSGGVSVTLDDGEAQPSVPVTMSFPVSAAALADEPAAGEIPESGSADASGLGVRSGNVALVSVGDDGTIELLPAVFDETAGTVVGEVPHFSSVWPVSLDFSWLVDVVLQGIGVASAKPSCEGRSVKLADATYSTTSQPQMWMCVDGAGEGLRVSALPNAATPFVATPSETPSWFTPSTEVSASGALAAAVGSAFMPEGSMAVFPGGSTNLFYDDPPGSFIVDLESAPALYVLQILSEVTGVLFNIGGGDLAEKLGGLECMGQVVPTGIGFGGDSLDPEDVVGIAESFFACVGPALEALGTMTPQQEVAFAIVSLGPQLVVGGFLGVLTSATGLGSASAPVDAVFDEDVLDDDQVAAFLGTWSGAIDQGSSDYSVEVTLKQAAGGKVRGSVRYPELGNCKGYWDAPRLDGTSLAMVEHITTGAGSSTGSCVAEVAIVVVLNDAGTELAYSADDGLAVGTLSRGKLATGTDTGGSRGWPTEKDEAPGALYAWFGANMFGLPQWVACDDARRWCAAEQGNEVLAIDLDGITEVGRAPFAAADPVAALVAAGVPAGSAAQIVS